MDIAQKVAEQIKKEHLQPIPKSHFVVRHVLIWGAVTGSVVMTGVASGVVVYLLQGHEWGVRGYTGDPFAKHLAVSLPYFWLLVTSVLLGLAVVSSRALRRGYAVRPIVYVGVYGAAALLVGAVIAETGRGARIEEALAPHIPAYEKLVERPNEDWHRPELGLMAGYVVEVSSDELVLRDCYGGRWLIQDNLAIWRCGAEKRSGERVKLIGSMLDGGTFTVNQVIPWDVTLAGLEHCIRNRALAP